MFIRLARKLIHMPERGAQVEEPSKTEPGEILVFSQQTATKVQSLRASQQKNREDIQVGYLDEI
jgi:hypothetical protein